MNQINSKEERPKGNLIYHNESYSFDLRSSITCSNFIWSNFNNLVRNPNIKYADDDTYIEFDIEALKDFILYLENSTTHNPKITNENVFTFNALSQKFQTKDLQNIIDKFINDNHIQLLPILLNKTILTEHEEHIITNHLIEYIENEELLSLPFPIIYRIISDYRRKTQQTDQQKEEKIMNFVVKCLDKFKSIASTLINYIDFDTVGQEIINIIKDKKYIDNNIVELPSLSNDSSKYILFNYQQDNKIMNNEDNISIIQSIPQPNIEIKNDIDENQEQYEKEFNDLLIKLRKQEIKIFNVPDGIATIKAEHFKNTCIEKVILPKSVVSIENESFAYCSSLYEVEINSQILKSIGDYSFSHCSKLERINIPDSVTVIGKNAFEGCSINSVSIPNGISTIQEYTFYYCEHLESIVIPNSASVIEKYAFCGCKIIKKIEIPNSLKSIGEYAFCDCHALESIHIPDSISTIEQYTFYNCEHLESIVIPNSVSVIEKYAFCGCKIIKKIEIPNSLKSIGEYAFDNCHALESIHIPDSISTIEQHTFFNCHALESINIPDSISRIEQYTFCNCYHLQTVKISPNIKFIGDYAFNDCRSLNNFEIPETVISIGNQAFFRCIGLKKVYLPNVNHIGSSAFTYCTIPEGYYVPYGSDIAISAFGANVKRLSNVE